MAIRLALAHSSSRLILALIVTATISAAVPETSFAGKFIAFTTPKAPASAGKDPTDLQITVTNGATISKGTAVLPNVAWPKPGKTGNGAIAGNVVTFTAETGLTGPLLRAGDVVTGTISLEKGVDKLEITGAEWSYPIPLVNQPFDFAANAVKVTKLGTGGGGTGLEGEAVVTNDTGATEYFSNFLLSYNIPAANFVDTGEGLQNASENNLYISSGVSVPTSITSLAPGEAATFFFGAGSVDKYDYIAFSFDAYSSPSLLPSTYLGGMGFADNAVPEPSTWAMLVLGFAGLGYASHRTRSRLLIA
jgi:hypothetical protein